MCTGRRQRARPALGAAGGLEAPGGGLTRWPPVPSTVVADTPVQSLCPSKMSSLLVQEPLRSALPSAAVSFRSPSRRREPDFLCTRVSARSSLSGDTNRCPFGG